MAKDNTCSEKPSPDEAADSVLNPQSDTVCSHAIDRRQFLSMAMMSSALLLSAKRGFALTEPALQAAIRPRSYAALASLPPGAVRPEGWLRTYMEKQVAQLGSQLPDVSWPFTEPYWKGEEQAESWWPWEQKAYWIDGATRLAIVMQDEALTHRVQESINYTLAHAAPDGYLGPSFFENPKGDFHRWPQNIFFRSLMASAEARDDAGYHIVDAVRKHYLTDTADYGVPTRNITNVEEMLWCYEQTGNPRLLTMAENAWREYMKKVAADPGHGDLSWMRVYADTPINAHGVTYAETCKLPAILYNHTGNDEYLKFALAAQRRIFDFHMLIDGIPSTSEWFRTRTALDSHETCDISDHTWSWGYLMMATGDGVWGDRIERACFNAGPGAIKNDWKALQYFSCPNQFLATLNSDHNVMEHGGRLMAYQPNPGQKTACCGGNVHRLLPNYVVRMWMRSPDGGLVATLYGPSKLNTVAGPNHVPVEIVQSTNYPFDEQINFWFNAAHPVTFPLSLRIPAWCSEPHIAVNGASIAAPAPKNGFITLRRRFVPGDTVTLVLPMSLAVSHWPQGGIGIEHGPLVYSLPIRENWTPIVEPRFTTPEFPSWNATPASPWNYGILLTSENLERQIDIQRLPMTEDPWTNPPISLSVPAKRIEDWDLMANPDNPEQKFTPSLPDLSVSKVSDAVETITLAPYGSTKLRVTIFPNLNT
ncbi:MAG TPA: beta-L-arabinofuranosidase domain-containing protein [Acidobacteriaceae bacterium]|nr:beta-L-arabinofuranosidase domain-containing protein [Acidobacteriaceae bacterium]